MKTTGVCHVITPQDNEVDTADEERQSAGLTEGAAALAEEQVKAM